MTRITIFFCMYAQNDIIERSPLLLFSSHEVRGRILQPRRGNSVVELLPSGQGVNCCAVFPFALFVHVFAIGLANDIIEYSSTSRFGKEESLWQATNFR
jgi:hypothetical protein